MVDSPARTGSHTLESTCVARERYCMSEYIQTTVRKENVGKRKHVHYSPFPSPSPQNPPTAHLSYTLCVRSSPSDTVVAYIVADWANCRRVFHVENRIFCRRVVCASLAFCSGVVDIGRECFVVEIVIGAAG